MEFLLLSRRRSSSRNVPSGEERGETDAFAGYIFCNVKKKKIKPNKNQTETLSPVFLLKRVSLDRITVLPKQVTVKLLELSHLGGSGPSCWKGEWHYSLQLNLYWGIMQLASLILIRRIVIYLVDSNIWPTELQLTPKVKIRTHHSLLPHNYSYSISLKSIHSWRNKFWSQSLRF